MRLLTPVPRLEGLAAEPAPKLARRVTELVAYLALHHPEAVTGERLRTRVLTSGGSDAQPKTLFNLAAEARRVLGDAARGHPALPRAGSGGTYRLAGAPEVDARRVRALVAEGAGLPPLEAALRYEAALALVAGEPLAGVRRGYGWWSLEGHEVAVTEAVVGAAWRLAALAVGEGRLDRAEWAVARGRLVEPGSEALARAAMVVAARRGDADALRRAWGDCCARLRGDDPATAESPSASTRRLYMALATRLGVDRPAPPREPPGGDQASLAAMEEAPRSTVPSAPAAL